MSALGAGTIRVPHGIYDVYVSRGLEWDIAVERAVKVGAEPARVEAHLSHVVDMPGWLSADFHVHAAPSPDSTVPLEHRVIEFVADGVEMIVSTDHNVISDYQPAINALGVGRFLTSAMGDELTTNGWGHFGAFPLPRNLAAAGQGATLVHGRTAQEIFGDVRQSAPGAIIDVHHPRLDAEVGYFNLGHLDPHSDRAERRGFSFEFDAVEVLNGYQDPVRRSVDRTIDDWMGLLNHGHIVTATGNSDTHHLTYNMGGYPRNYVRVPDDQPARVQPAQVATAIKEHRAFSRPARCTAGGRFARIGDVAPARGGHADAGDRGSGGAVDLGRPGDPLRRRQGGSTLVGPAQRRRGALQASRAGHGGARRLCAGAGRRRQAHGPGRRRQSPFGVRPLALTNPIFLDVDGNGRYDPPYPHGIR